jgi:hypothetical protein
MNNRQLYLAWLRTAAPTVYATALRKVTGQKRTLGGLTDNLVQQAFSPSLRHSFLGDDTSSMDTTFMDYGSAPITTGIDTSPIVLDPIVLTPPVFDASSVTVPSLTTSAPTIAATTPAPSTFASILTAVASIGSSVVTASNQSALIALNTQRAAQGLPPVNANGQVVTAAGTATTSASLLAFENAISGGSGSLLPILAIAGLAAYFIFGRKSAA